MSLRMADHSEARRATTPPLLQPPAVLTDCVGVGELTRELDPRLDDRTTISRRVLR